ncbi:MAG TPA: glycerophosphodiester phosphodiesterase family protein [Candidatus Saccharimonadales bacterium]|nr:glycerophosphodiester phosphodiesterase family protein [Candidatus Saccharimonadales bacterium]
MPVLFRSIKKPHLFAHRGGNAAEGAYENTAKAFKSAVRLGYKFIETDVIVTRDNQVLCYHGAHNWYTKRHSGLELRRKVQKLTYAQVRAQKLPDGQEIPKLEDILRAYPKVLFSIDVKTREAIGPLVKLIKRLGAEDRVIITSFSLYRSLKANQLLRGHDRQASLCLSRVSAKALSPINSLFIRYIRLLGVRYLQISYTRINKRLIRLAHKNNIYVYAWTVNNQKAMKKMVKLGVDGIMSDESELLLKTVKNKKV